MDDRLREWRDQDNSREGIADLMLAVKWIGNTGTHEDESLSSHDVLGGVRLLNEAFHRLYVSPAITAAAAAINASRGAVVRNRQDLWIGVSCDLLITSGLVA